MNVEHVIYNNDSPVRENRKLVEVLYFRYEDMFNFDHFCNKISSIIRVDSNYSLLVRIQYKSDLTEDVTEWKSLGNQIGGFHTTSNSELLDVIRNCYENILNRLESSMDIYRYNEGSIVAFQLLIYRLGKSSITNNVFNRNSLKENRDLVNVSKVSRGFSKMFPITISKKELFKTKLSKVIDNNLIKYIILNNQEIDFVSRINNFSISSNNVTSFNKGIDFYFKEIEDRQYIITKEYISLTNNVIINVYDVDGLHIQRMIDTDISENNFTREIGNVIFYIDNRGIYNKVIKTEFSPVFPTSIKGRYSNLLQPDYKFGSLDLETFKYTDSISKTYAIGFHVKNNTQMYYVDDDYNYDNVIIKCLEDMLVEKYNGYTFYVHNLGKFDILFLLKVLANLDKEYPNKFEYKNNIVFRDDTVISIDISTKKGKNKYTIKIVDSLNFLQSSLDKLSKTFNTEHKKGFFPYNFVNKNKLFYVGNKPDKKYFSIDSEDVNLFNIEYKKMSRNNWDLKEETLTYLKSDLRSLYEVMNKFISTTYINYHVHVTKCLTISSLSMDIFLREFYDKNIPLVKQKSIYSNLKKGYFGGITEVYKPYGKNLYYYDVNSLYPFSALNPMPGLNCSYVEKINKNICDLKEIFGFYYCKITTNNNYIGLLPYRDDSGILMPEGTWEGWYFSEELKFASDHGYDINVLHGYDFNKEYDVFKKYITELYEIKSSTKDQVQRTLAKSMLNNLIGRFGLDINKYTTELVSESTLINILQTKKVRSIKHIDDNSILVTHDINPSKDICISHNIDYDKVLFESTINKGKTIRDDYHDVSIPIASAVTAYSRIYMNKIKLDILNKGGSIYYTDTDSIVTDIELDSSIIGDEIGKFKLEHKIAEGYFISNKTYAIKTDAGKVIIKNKGSYNKPLNEDDFIRLKLNDSNDNNSFKPLYYEHYKDLYLGNNVESFKYITKKDYSLGSVTIKVPSKITLSPHSYTKRVKVFDNGLWVNTKPLTIGSNSNSYHTSEFNINTGQTSLTYNKQETNLKSLNLSGLMSKLNNCFIYLLISFPVILSMVVCYMLSTSLYTDCFIQELVLISIDYSKEILETELTDYNEEILNCNKPMKTNSNRLFSLSKFIDLFLNNRFNAQLSLKDSLISYIEQTNLTNTNENVSNLGYTNSSSNNIINFVLNHHLDLANTQIDNLKEQVSILKMQLLKSEINNLDRIKELDSIITDLDNKSFKSPTINTLSPMFTQTPSPIVNSWTFK